MTILSALRGRFSGHAAADSPAADGDAAPFAGYDDLDGKQVTDQLSKHSQSELTAVESYERSHKSRERVLDKLRYMRGSEPLPGYDALSVDEIAAALGTADLGTIKKVRGYERKFANRPQVLEAVARVQHRSFSTQPASAGPAYQPTTYQSSSAKPPDERPEQESGGR